MSQVSIAQNDKIEISIQEALEKISLEEKIKGKIVVIKPNETFCTKKNKAPVTQPDTLRTVIWHVRKFSPKRLIVAGGAGAIKTWQSFKISGMAKVVKEEKVEFIDLNEEPYVVKKLDFGPQKEVVVNKLCEQWDTLISLANHKRHDSAVVTLSMKNIAMSLPAAGYYGYPRSSYKHDHRFFDDLHSFIAGMCQKFPISLAIVVGHPSMLRTGPIDGVPVETGFTVVSEDPVSTDAVGAKLFGFNPGDIKHIKLGNLLKVGESNLKKIEILGIPLDKAVDLFNEKVRNYE